MMMKSPEETARQGFQYLCVGEMQIVIHQNCWGDLKAKSILASLPGRGGPRHHTLETGYRRAHAYTSPSSGCFLQSASFKESYIKYGTFIYLFILSEKILVRISTFMKVSLQMTVRNVDKITEEYKIDASTD